MTTGIISYGTYLPHYRLNSDELAAAHGKSPSRRKRVVAAFDEDSTTMAVAAGRVALAAGASRPKSVYLATTSPVYVDKCNAVTAHAALGLDPEAFASDVSGSARGSIAAIKAAANSGGLALMADVRTGRPGSLDETDGSDGAAAFLFAANQIDGEVLAELVAEASVTEEFLDRWRIPGRVGSEQWEERFGLDLYLPLVEAAAALVLDEAGLEHVDHVVLVSPNTAVSKRADKIIKGRLSTSSSPVGHAGAADVGLALAAALDAAAANETIMVLSVADGCDALVFRTTAHLESGRQPVPVLEQLSVGKDVGYPKYLSWRGLLSNEPPRRPDPERPAAPPAARALRWKYAFEGSRCLTCDFVHLPPARICKRCGSIDEMTAIDLSAGAATGRIATYTVDRLAFSPSPPLVNAVIDFDDGGRYTMEVADAELSELAVGARVTLTFRSLFSAGGVSNYFWKAKILPSLIGPATDRRVSRGLTHVGEQK